MDCLHLGNVPRSRKLELVDDRRCLLTGIFTGKNNTMLPELETPRLWLRELELAHAEETAAFQKHPTQWQYQAIEPEEFADGKLRIERYLQHRGPPDQQRILSYSAFDKKAGHLVGQVSLSRSSPKIASLGFGVSLEMAGQGLATEMAQRLLEFGFGAVGLHRIEAYVAPENKPCIRVLKKLSMTYEGTLRECIWAQGRWWNDKVYSILAHEYSM
jgi:[ribosomal protein S5]-alanine N-acetyltransferase